jgi:hypothetical protein
VTEGGEALRQRLQPGAVDIATGAVRQRDRQAPVRSRSGIDD